MKVIEYALGFGGIGSFIWGLALIASNQGAKITQDGFPLEPTMHIVSIFVIGSVLILSAILVSVLADPNYEQ